MEGVLRAIDKEFSLLANYPKGHGDHFKMWIHKHHSNAPLMPVTNATGARNDLIVEGAAAVYWNRRYYIGFLDENLHGSDNILQHNLFLVLLSTEMIAMLRIYAIYDIAVNKKM